MLPKKQRVPRVLFGSFQKAALFKNSLFLLKKASFNGDSLFVFSVTKKVAKSAVVRNRIRRMGYRVIKKILPSIKPDFLVNFSFVRIPVDQKEVEEKLIDILKTAKLIK